MSGATLATLQEKAATQTEREHVTYYVRCHSEQFSIGELQRSPSLAHLRWTVDEPADFELVLVENDNAAGHLWDMSAGQLKRGDYQLIVKYGDFLAQQPELTTLNTRHKRNEGLANSLAKENHI